MNQFPAIVIGGPPHSGKSVLTYSLTQVLRHEGVAHYVLRACPDGEGDWSNEALSATVRLIRRKGNYTDQFVSRVCCDLERRHLPLLVDAGGRPTQEQEVMFDYCTHAILVAQDAEGLAQWRAIAERHGLVIMAELVSTLTETDTIYAHQPVLSARIAGLERHHTVNGLVLDALCQRIAALFAYPESELRQMHLGIAPVEMVVELTRLGQALDLGNDTNRWQPDHLPAILAYLPAAEPLAMYGRGPGWLYAAIACQAQPAPFFQFDPRLGWIEPIRCELTSQTPSDDFAWQTIEYPNHTRLEIQKLNPYLDYGAISRLQVPLLERQQGLVISGSLPHWLLTGLVLSYNVHMPWVGVYQPQLNDHAVLVASSPQWQPIGKTIWSPAMST